MCFMEMMPHRDIGDARRAAGGIAVALWAQGESRGLAADLQTWGVDAMLLKGPDLQLRLYGSPAVYPSGDVDILVHPRHADEVRSHLERTGWSFEPGNGFLWRLSRAATYERGGFRVDVHWGLHAAHLPWWSLRELEAAMWSNARPGPSGMLEPDASSLLVFLAVHVVGHSFERRQWHQNVLRCASIVDDWNRVWSIADRSHVRTAVELALTSDVVLGTRVPVRDGLRGRAEWTAAWILRGHFLPASLRARAREAASLAREGFGFVPTRRRTVQIGDARFVVPRGVIGPSQWSEHLVDLWIDGVSHEERPVLVDVGTGIGVFSVLASSARPDAIIVATDVSPRAVRATRANLRRNGCANVRVRLGGLLSPLPTQARGRVSSIVANLPSVPPSSARRTRWSSPMGTVEGQDADGLGHVRELLVRATQFLRDGGSILLPLQLFQWETLAPEARALGYVTADLPPPPGRQGVVGRAVWRGDMLEG